MCLAQSQLIHHIERALEVFWVSTDRLHSGDGHQPLAPICHCPISLVALLLLWVYRWCESANICWSTQYVIAITHTLSKAMCRAVTTTVLVDLMSTTSTSRSPLRASSMSDNDRCHASRRHACALAAVLSRKSSQPCFGCIAQIYKVL